MKKDKQSYTKFCLKFNDLNDSIIIDKLWSLSNKTEYVRGLIKEDLKVVQVPEEELKRGEND